MTYSTSNLNLAPAPTNAPNCYRCGMKATQRVTLRSNPNGNAGRPYYKCEECGTFLVFNDDKGNFPENPPCCCGESSKMLVSDKASKVPGRLFFGCRLGECDFYERVYHSGF